MTWIDVNPGGSPQLPRAPLSFLPFIESKKTSAASIRCSSPVRPYTCFSGCKEYAYTRFGIDFFKHRITFFSHLTKWRCFETIEYTSAAERVLAKGSRTSCRDFESLCTKILHQYDALLLRSYHWLSIRLRALILSNYSMALQTWDVADEISIARKSTDYVWHCVVI